MSSRWAQYDEDDYRLPDGMRRVGYDADTQTYTYRDADGSLWEGPPGARYGKLTQIEGPTPSRRRTPSPPRAKDHAPRESSDQRSTRRFVDFSQVDQIEDRPVIQHEDWRLLAPFLLIRRSLTSSKNKKKKRQSSNEKRDEGKEREAQARVSRRSTI